MAQTYQYTPAYKTAGAGQIQTLDNVSIKVTDTVGGGYKYLKNILNFIVDWSENDLMHWSCILLNCVLEDSTIDPDAEIRKYTPEVAAAEYYHATAGTWIAPLKRFKWDVDVQTTGTGGEDIDGTQQVETMHWYYLTPTDMQINVSDGNVIVTVSGVDYGYSLMVENQTMTTFRNQQISDILNSIGTQFSVNMNIESDVDLSGDLYSDRKIKYLHFQGEIPLDIIKRLLSIRGAKFRFYDNCMYIYLPAYRNDPIDGPTFKPTWRLRDKNAIKSISYVRKRWDISTRCLVRRVSDSSLILFEDEGNNTEEHTVEKQAAFPNGGIFLTMQQEVKNGEIQDIDNDHYIVMWSGDGKTGDNANWPNLPSPSVKSMSLFYQPRVDVGPADPQYYHIVVRAIPYDPTSDESYDDLKTAFYINTTLETLLGESRPNPDPIIEPLIPSWKYLKEYSQVMLMEESKKFEMCSLETYYSPRMKPGDTCNLADFYGLGNYSGLVVSGYLMYYENVKHDAASMTTSLLLSKPRRWIKADGSWLGDQYTEVV